MSETKNTGVTLTIATILLLIFVSCISAFISMFFFMFVGSVILHLPNDYAAPVGIAGLIFGLLVIPGWMILVAKFG